MPSTYPAGAVYTAADSVAVRKNGPAVRADLYRGYFTKLAEEPRLDSARLVVKRHSV